MADNVAFIVSFFSALFWTLRRVPRVDARQMARAAPRGQAR